jgi:hypothetical protein
MNAIIIQSPLIQLNAPYPSGAYLSSFFKSQGLFTKWLDFSNEMFYQIFSKEGLSYIFEATEKTACKMADDAEKNGDENTAFNLRRYVSTKDYWINWIDFIVASLCDGNKIYSTRELFHQFLYSPFAPRGNRMEQYLSNIEKEATIEKAYPNIFVVKYEENERNVTYSYTDVLTRTVEVDVFDGENYSPLIPPAVQVKA